MKKGIIFILISTLLLSVVLLFVSRDSMEKKSDKIVIVATLFPQYDFAKQIGGDKVDVSLLLTPGTETHTYEPTPQDIIKINDADLYLYTGKYMEPWSDRISNGVDSDTKIVDVSANVNLIESEHDEHEEDKNHEGEPEQEGHNHGYDPHIWLDPDKAIVMVNNIADALISVDGENTEYYRANANRYIAEIQNLDNDINKTIEEAESKKLAFGGTFAYAYFINKYNLEYVSAYDSCGEDTEPSVTNIKKVIDYMKENSINVIFYQEMSSGKIADAIAKETGAQKLVFHTVHNATLDEINRGETYVTIMRKNLENLKIALKQNKE